MHNMHMHMHNMHMHMHMHTHMHMHMRRTRHAWEHAPATGEGPWERGGAAKGP